MGVSVKSRSRTISRSSLVDPMERIEQSSPSQLFNELQQLGVDVSFVEGDEPLSSASLFVTILSCMDPDRVLGAKVLALVTVRHGALGLVLKGNRTLPSLTGTARVLIFGRG